jgi:DnaJ-class molecular chaperone
MFHLLTKDVEEDLTARTAAVAFTASAIGINDWKECENCGGSGEKRDERCLTCQ